MFHNFALMATSLISFILGVIIGEPLKHYINKHINKKEVNLEEKQLMIKLNKLIPNLLKEMKEDLKDHPLNREFIIMSKKHCYNGEAIVYYFEDHSDLKDKMVVLENYGLIINITYNNTDRYRMTEQFVEMINKYC